MDNNYSPEDEALAQLIGRRIKELRKKRGWGQADLEAHLDDHVRRASLSDFETGRRLPSLRTLRRIASAFEIEPACLLLDVSKEKHRSALDVLSFNS